MYRVKSSVRDTTIIFYFLQHPIMPTPRKIFAYKLVDDRKPNRSLSSDTKSAIITAYLFVELTVKIVPNTRTHMIALWPIT